MPKRSDLKRILVIGSGPIVIGQACEFDYSGTQACKALRAEGPRGRAGQQQSGHDHDGPGDRRPHLRRAAHRRARSPPSSSASARTRCCRPSAARPRSTWPCSSPRKGCSKKYRRRADRRLDRRNQGRRGSPALPRRDERDRPRDAQQPLRASRCEEAFEAVDADRLPDHHPSVVHARRRRRRHRLQHRGVPRDRAARPQPQPGARGVCSRSR